MIKHETQVNRQRRIIGWVAIAMTVLVLGPACASTGSSGDRGSRDVLTREQLEPMDHLTAYDAIRRTRAFWLRTARGTGSFNDRGGSGLRVYVDGVGYGDAESLRDLDVGQIQQIRFLDRREATTRFGTDHSQGAIMVTLRN